MGYKTFTGLIDAMNEGATITMMIDNDNVSAINKDGETVFEMHPTELLEEALTMLGISWEYV